MTGGGRSGISRAMAALAALVAGLALGIALHGSEGAGVRGLVGVFDLIGQLWVAALRMAALPLVIVLTLAAIVGAKRDGDIGTLGVKTPLLFTAMLFSAGVIAIAVTAPVVSLYPADAATASAFGVEAAAPDAPVAVPQSPAASVRDWLIGLVPANVFRSAANGDVLPILLFTVLFAFAVTRIPAGPRGLLGGVFQALADAMLQLVGLLLRLLPLGVFALCAAFSYRAGFGVTGVLAVWIALCSGVLLLITLLLYPVTAVFGRVSPARFARAVAPAQVVAASTRSSIAALPALVDGGRRHLGLPPSATGFVLPLAVAAFKLNMTVSGPVKLLFLAHVFHRPLGVSQMAAFLAIELLLSFSTAGIPSLGTVRSLPAYLAAGIPLEAVLILNSVDTIPDVFKTLTNVTGDMSAATILSRRERARGGIGAAPAGVEEAAGAGSTGR